MQVKSLQLVNLGPIHNSTLELPPTGVVLVTGANGSGKSTLVEAVAHSAWGASLRGAACWRTNANSGVCINTDRGEITRSQNAKGKANLLFAVDGIDLNEYATITKRQEALESRIGTFDVWRSACTFHSDDAGRFTRATDVDRKKLLESVLDLASLDKAYAKCRAELSNTTNQRDKMLNDARVLDARVDGVYSKIDAISGLAEDVEPLDELRAAYRTASAEHQRCSAAADEARAAMDAARTASAACAAAVDIAGSNLERALRSAGTCAACGQRFPDFEQHAAHVGDLEEKLNNLRDTMDDAAADFAEASKVFNARYDEANRAKIKLDAATARGLRAKEIVARNAEREGKIAQWKAEARELEQTLGTLYQDLDTVKTRIAELECSVKALAPTGARAAVLDGSLATLQVIANDVLAKLGMPVTVRLASSVETKGGKTLDKISFDVDGAGGGNGYYGASSGERRRIDLAMLLAIGQLASATNGVSNKSTLFFDELFDALDEDGIDAACELITDLARKRCVVVISHNKNLASRLAAAKHFTVKDGYYESL